MNTINRLQELYEQSLGWDELKFDHSATSGQISFDNDAQVILPETLFGRVAPLHIESSTLQQFCVRLGPPVLGGQKSLPTSFLEKIPADWRAYNLQRAIERDEPDRRWLIREWNGNCRAALSASYAPVSNTKLCELLTKVAEGTGGQGIFVREVVNRDYLSIRWVWKQIDAGPKGPYGFGIHIGNGETGNANLTVLPLIWRGGCTNTAIVDDENAFHAVHRGDADYLWNRVVSVFTNAFKLAGHWLDTFIKAEEIPLNGFENILEGIVRDNGWGEKELIQISLGTEGSQTYGGVINGLTFFSQQIEDPKERDRVDIMAGQWLMKASKMVEVVEQ